MTIVIKQNIKNISGILLLLFLLAGAKAQMVNDIIKYQAPQSLPHQKDMSTSIVKKKSGSIGNSSLQQRFEVFTDLAENEIYQITLAADVPDNKRPMKVYYKKEPGHVFVILEQKDTVTKKSVAQTWGFYPDNPISSLFVRTVKCKILDNSNRTYDAAITQSLTREQFELVKQKAIALTVKKYNLNKYNCYDYAVELFNAIPGVEDLPLIKVKFPFVFGRGGSPCGLYKQLVKLKNINTNKGVVIVLNKSPVNKCIMQASH